MVVWFTGPPGSGKTTQARLLADAMRKAGTPVEVLDGDEIRQNLSAGLGFTRQDRDVNVLRIGFVARLLARHGVTVIVAAVSPYRDTRRAVRQEIEGEGSRFVEVAMTCSRDVLVARDPKGHYARALSGGLPQFTGIDDPYEDPHGPALALASDSQAAEAGCARILAYLATLPRQAVA